MTSTQIILMVTAIVVGVAAINATVWILIFRAMRRRADRMREELSASGEKIILGPERATYRGSTNGSRVRGLGTAALTDRRLVFRGAFGTPIEIPRSSIASVRDEKVFLGGISAGKSHVVLRLHDGSDVGFYFRDPSAWRTALAPHAA
jgi:hypothetical protein